MRKQEQTLLLWAAVTAAAITIGWFVDARPVDYAALGFLVGAAFITGAIYVRLDVGTISLSAVPMFSAAALLTPREAALVGIAGNLVRAIQVRRSSRVPLVFAYTVWVSLASLIGALILKAGMVGVGWVSAVLAAAVLNVAVSAATLAVWHNATMRQELAAVPWRTVGEAYLYFLFAALLLTVTLGDRHDYLISGGILVLALALTYGTANRALSDAMGAELSAASDRLRYVTMVDSELHRLKNYVSAIQIWLGVEGRLEGTPIGTATSAAAEILRNLGRKSQSSVVKSARIDLVVVAREAFALAAPSAIDEGIALVDALGENSLPVIANRIELRDVVFNLLANAIRASRRGGRVEMSGRRDGSWCTVAIRDWAGGFSPDAAKGLFTVRKPSSEGYGIGLVSSNLAVQQFGGRLLYQPRRGGSEITVRLPDAF